MEGRSYGVTAVLLAYSLTLPLGLYADPLISSATSHPCRLLLDQRSTLWISGDSTFHPYESTATQLDIASEFPPFDGRCSPEGLAQLKRMKKFELTIPIRNMRSGKSLLDKNMFEALNSREYPDITFVMSSYEARLAPANEGKSVVEAEGTLTVAGRPKDIALKADVEMSSASARIVGETEVLMTDFGIKPPTLLFGALRTADKVVVHYDILLRVE